ncbi:4-oxalocrotonate tautomerase [Agrobacterium fabrum]|uniref:4-oxalocrotonate tautomerase n=1 Tax=Agrobacterium fabrum TaxID=1176649 RepID=A0A7Z7FS29_9HYPH|nr:4-oxalocrotonate tautomerase [Agrobacterium fabrum]
MPVVRVSWFSGNDTKAKAAVAAEITESIVRNTRCQLHLRLV